MMICLKTLVSAIAFTALSSAASAGYSGLYIFGDSLSDAGNVATFVTPVANQPINNSWIPSAPYASGQFTNGNVWAKSFANALGLPAGGVAALTGGSDFAFGGARVATDGAGLAPSLQAQTNLFLNGSGNAAPSGALYVVAGGGNDARDILNAAAASANPTAVIAAAAQTYAASEGLIIDQLQAAGAKTIIVWDVPNLALAPAVTAQGAGASFLAGLVSNAMNSALAARMTGEAGVSIFDIYGFTSTASAFGFTNVTDACGGVVNCDASKYLFWDGLHPTAAAHALLAQQMLLAAAAVPEPGTYALLLSGLLLIGWRIHQRRQRALKPSADNLS